MGNFQYRLFGAKKYKFIEVRPWGVTPIPHELLKKFNQNFYQNAITLRFSGEKMNLHYKKFDFFKHLIE